MDRDHVVALLEAYLVTFLWSSSYVLVKFGLTQVLPLTLVALRYILASIFLVPLALFKGETNLLRKPKDILKLVFLGLTGYTIAQGLQCVGLFYLPAVSVTFILNFTPVIVLILGIIVLKEIPTPLQLFGMGLSLIGAYLYFNEPLSSQNITGAALTLVSGTGWAIYLVSSKFLFDKKGTTPLGLTAFSMSLGTIVLTAASFSIEALPLVSYSSWIIIVWLGIVNTALAFFLWNHALQRLEAFEISVLQNTMLVQIAILAWVFLQEQFIIEKLIPMTLVFLGALIVQLRK